MYYESNACSVPVSMAEQANKSLPQSWQAKLPFEIQQSSYTIKTANSKAEFDKVLELRREVFLSEFASHDISDQSDFEAFDLDADFLIIMQGEEVIASYRLIYSDYSKNFYSASEFDIKPFLKNSSRTLELSRACVKKGKRAGIALHLLWRGIAEYMTRSGAQFLFGCSSVQSLDLQEIVNIYRFLKQEGVLSDEFDICPHANYHLIKVEGMLTGKQSEPEVVDSSLIPPLLLGYIKAGAKIYGAPAVDLRFGCIDFFTVLDFERLSKSFLRKYIQRQIQ
ncbi:GNAT family N-acetyltransferase [Pseudobacteriovorax antillogorgiicola]|uniref:Putative hemolysin n=1 Tax=Pseudobacteriovorax antillogorgiicola TaxID=1513793 RepID=A0A1Y6BD14_9BACT|nr:GNAT family N-acyltransferase [Pseudobacteriovorax antillogorgiicola]TCS56461.1 ornithine-acyl[acyl carrier protein] N-acyltransferase [Pseudobacteriovorax antillogorgiicola]SMF05197.1 Putative hemolysin [Pseudobacteriovorax antillogorgiicola]